jgi:sulfur-carrier protein adenylyltransferase/sulfurtransferase
MNYSNLLSDPELRRFDEQISLPEIGIQNQEKFKNTKIAVVGAGGLGSFILQHLAAIGIGHLAIIDYSMVEEKNIQRQTLYGGNDLGKLKTIISKQNLQNLFPFVSLEIINIELTSSNIERILQPFSLVIDATNNIKFHELMIKANDELHLPWIIGSVNQFSGLIAVFKTLKESTFGHFREIEDQYFSETRRNSGNTVLSYGLIGNIVALEVLKLLVENEASLEDKVLIVDTLKYQFAVKSMI